MSYEKIKSTLKSFYENELTDIAKGISERVFARMDALDKEQPGMSAYRLKSELYTAIADEITPVIFDGIPFPHETGALCAFSDGKFNRGGMIHANGWLYLRNEHIFRDVDPHAYEVYRKNGAARLYAQTGSYVDIMHIGIPMKKVFAVGLCGIYEECLAALDGCSSEEREFIECSISGILALKRIAEKFAARADEMGYTELRDIVTRVPWNPPVTMHEGLATLAFMRKALGALEGVGFNSFGRVDLLLYPLYENDIKRGVSEAELLDLVTRFLIIWDTALDTRAPMTNNYEYELENTLTLGGRDINGREVYNGVTRLFLRARKEHNFLYPKMMLRYSASSSDEYLGLITSPLIEGKSFSLYANDDSIIPALTGSGIDGEDAVDYVIGGCWDALTPDVANRFSGEYLNILVPLEWMVHEEYGEMEKNELDFGTFRDVLSFEELYEKYIRAIRLLLERKAGPMSVGSRKWCEVNPLATLSALMQPCIPKKTDITAGGGKYNRECVYFCGFAEVVDSLLAIKNLCFSDNPVCTLEELLSECRCNFKNEVLRQRAISAPSYGDGSEESSAFAARLHDDLYRVSRGLPTAYGGEFRIGFNQYTEIIWWGKATKAIPSGRRDGDFLSQGMSPSRLIRRATAVDVLDSVRYMDMTKCAANASVTVALPREGLDGERVISFFRAVSRSGIQSLQPNIVSREELLAAQKDPEHYGHIIVRVCGFSAPFVLLSRTYQEEILSRLSTEF
ncbi:MAG: hypothetical protein IJX38_01490 [Clostridia bacterium]|nr:hypothetical protein [Clostridia bacterium]